MQIVSNPNCQLNDCFSNRINLPNNVNMDFINLINEFLRIGCKRRLHASVAARVFQDLELDKRHHSVAKCFEESLEIVFLRALTFNDASLIFLPLLDTEEVNFKRIEELRNKLCISEQNNLFLAICDPSSNILYYQLTPNL
ncbi:uncharacterized protein LOC101891966 [Musca domestica]|uniref:Uncharacterized protein LOC101891966 isoform X1 n=2 Tax=Musca domestica TaxID=7370 RepID=A0A1I8N1C6_MUSDO|nr:uncharacterized protein LOC101891966 [Musca domestica]